MLKKSLVLETDIRASRRVEQEHVFKRTRPALSAHVNTEK